ncbi:MAG: MmcB family DNA repair protein [Erythrobacter sp.]
MASNNPSAIDSLSADNSGVTAPTSQHGAEDVARGVCRMFARNDIWCLTEMPLRNNRRADLMGIDAKGHVIIVEIKVARSDLLGDGKWPDYLDYCDRFFWGVPPDLDRGPLESEAYQPDSCGVIVADGYDAEILRPAPLLPLAAARRKVEIERLARAALRRHNGLLDARYAQAVNGQ